MSTRDNFRPLIRLTVLVACLLLLTTFRPVTNFADSAGPRFQGTYAIPPATFDAELVIVSWNIHFGEAVETALVELEQANSEERIDVLLLQEMDQDGTATLAAALGMNYVYFPASIHSHHRRNFGNAVLSRWPIVESNKLILPYRNPKNGQMRIAVRAVLAVNGVRLPVYSVHTETYWLGPIARRGQIAALAEALAAEPGPVIVGGDFNTLTQRSVRRLHDQLNAVGLVAAGAGETVRMGPFGFMLDHIFTRGFSVDSSTIAADTAASDHLALTATLEWPMQLAISGVR
jgi:endonuclease/exonuclease/phosphatase family metal-dependent hydrolase